MKITWVDNTEQFNFHSITEPLGTVLHGYNYKGKRIDCVEIKVAELKLQN